ncbi:hypothetical protein FVR03_01290 [Pontibacter qinzhouensis]|uniref:Uncharacterized protein n=1 Tax=Pontibacter qinzhouensis TaxID=2603253 RepID=A0A5C8KD75_9BACT|nr:hypothetical protein [Pontibacter qinzhouensis]TXK52378.1 hypothetical protein FVR03_01290 [Pontibacter qinzhouensis]
MKRDILFKITNPGKVSINTVTLLAKSDEMAIVEADLNIKGCEFLFDENTESGLEITIMHPDETGATTFLLPELKGYTVYLAATGRYTLRICLTSLSLSS